MSYIVNVQSFANNFLPGNKRLAKYKAFVYALLKPLQVLFDTMFGTYKDGDTSVDWDVLTAYVVGDKVKYTDKSIYQCWVANTGNVPTDNNYWFKIQDKFVGIEPRMKYASNVLLFEWALNEWFGTTFVNTTGASDIYITQLYNHDTTFWIGYVENESSPVTYNEVDTFGYIQYTDLVATTYEFQINVPVAIWTALDSNLTNRDLIIRSFANTYVFAGINYKIVTY
jgi:hypothetical protein